MTEYDYLTCIHRLADGSTGLCDQCQAEHAEDPQSWYEFGFHPRGQEAWADLQRELAARPVEGEPDPTLPL